MPQTSSALKKAIRERMAATGESRRQAIAALRDPDPGPPAEPTSPAVVDPAQDERAARRLRDSWTEGGW